ncbi:MAG: khg/kdpg aldolase [Herbinix sp.]|jgi:2-dehydro-3-deoxyphosphogluconate aldolase/(4S)-4-hydroxy-2-oxoglutarate aldolase|nr:khg/kdpg aldolase [Herbinix sp.]
MNTMNAIQERIHNTGLVPVVVIDDAAQAVATAEALIKGGVDVMEITMRTAAGMEAIRLVSEANKDMLVGAGTVLTMEQCKNAIQNGAKFIVSPGYDPEIVEYCITEGVVICPGCVTPTEITAAIKKGLKVLKFFPANIYGGLKAIKALAGPFGGIRFIPTGGVDASNLADFNNDVIFAVGGGWLCTREDIKAGNFEAITDACSKSVDILLGVKDEAYNSVSLNALIEKGGDVTTINLSRLSSQLTRRGFAAANTENGMEYVKDQVKIIAKAV